MRGSHSIYRNLFDEPVAEIAAIPQPSLRHQKIDCILYSYYYNGRKEIIINGRPVRMNYPSLLETVSGQFFLSTFTLHDIIQKNTDRLALIKQEWKDRPVNDLQKHLVKQYPMFVW